MVTCLCHAKVLAAQGVGENNATSVTILHYAHYFNVCNKATLFVDRVAADP